MIVQTRENKDLVIPKSLGNFVTEGSGGGITPEEAAEIASAVTEEAISEYDIELQVDLEDIRDAVSGNSEDIATLSGVTESISQQIGSLSGLTDDIAAISGQTTANTQDIGILSGATVAIEQSLGNYATTADTKAIQDSLANYATTATTDGLSTDITALSAVTSGIAADIETLSGSVKEDVILDVAEIYNMEYADRVTLWDETYAKLVAGHSVFAKGEILNGGGYSALIPLFKYHPETSPQYHTGGFLVFAAKSDDSNSFAYYSFSSAGNISPNRANVQQNTIYSLPTASSSTKGGIKVGSGLTMSGEVMSIKAGDGLGFSGDTLVVSGGTSSNTKVVMLNDLTEQERVALYNELSSLYDYNANGWTSAYTEDMYAFYLDLRTFQQQDAAQTIDKYEGFFPMQCDRMHPSDYGGAAFFTGVQHSREGNGQLICIRLVITSDGQVDGPSTWLNTPSQSPEYNRYLYITTAGTIADDQDWSSISDEEKAGIVRMRYNGSSNGEEAPTFGSLKWWRRYHITYNDEVKWYYVWSADVLIDSTVYTGVWGCIQDEWYSSSNVPPQLISWTSGATITLPYQPLP